MKNITSKQTQKTFYITKVAPSQSKSVSKEVNSLFEDPSTFLRLPGESKRHFIVGKKLCGPRYDTDDQVIPYSIVGNPKIFKKKNLNANISSIHSQSKFTGRPDPNIVNSNIITDNKLDELFTRCRDNIESNSTYTNDFLLSIPSNKDETVKKPLMLQQRTLENFSSNNRKLQMISDKIRKKIYNGNFISARSNYRDYHKQTHYYYPIKNKDLLIDSGDKFRMKKETMEYVQNNADFHTRYGQYHWMIGLRRPKNFNGIREAYINIGNLNRPVWCTIREKLPIINETVVNPYKSNETERLLTESEGMKSYMKTSPSLMTFMNKTMNMVNLEIKGKNLLQVEEENAKLLKGKKKRLLHMKDDKDMKKELNFVENWH
jgi:hypothetical protein